MRWWFLAAEAVVPPWSPRRSSASVGAPLLPAMPRFLRGQAQITSSPGWLSTPVAWPPTLLDAPHPHCASRQGSSRPDSHARSRPSALGDGDGLTDNHDDPWTLDRGACRRGKWLVRTGCSGLGQRDTPFGGT